MISTSMKIKLMKDGQHILVITAVKKVDNLC